MDAGRKLQSFRHDPCSRHLHKVKELAEKEGVSEELRKEIDRVIELMVARDEYCENITSAASPELVNLVKETHQHPWEQAFADGKIQYKVVPKMMSGHHEVQFLKSLVSMTKAKKVLELGLFTGCAALAIAEALPEDGIVYSCELLPYCVELARSLVDKSPHGKKIHILTGPALDGIKTLGDRKESFDIVFIDADKSNYANYYQKIFELDLLAPGGTIIVDNALMQGYPYSHENPYNGTAGPAIEKFNDMVRPKTDIHRVMVPLRDGVMLIRRKSDVDQS